jgi:NapC/NirT cytochrome c family, N-terminal region.
MNFYRSTITICIIISSVFLVSQCINKDNDKPEIIKNAFGEQFAGSATCANCHKNIYDSHLKTAHHLTSQPAFEKYIKGSFDPGKNTYSYTYSNSVVVAMEKRGDGFYQVEYFRGEEKHAYPFNIVVGSGTMGQSYLYWKDQHLFQLPITYFSAAKAWSNSPGFPDKVRFNRIITSRCLECHTTFVKKISSEEEEDEKFDNKKIIYAVDCEKCHGPAAKHVEFQTQNPKINTAKYIINPAKLSRQQNLDLCALCHGGRLQKTRPSFEFTVGKKLSDYFIVDTSAPNPENIDVHGNQYGLLRASKCFRMSTTLTCNTCHNTHENEKGKIALFSQRCMTCHENVHQHSDSISKLLGSTVQTNCIDCHMPLKSSRVIAVQLKGGTIPIAASIRSHFITIYPIETERIIMAMKKSDQIH